MKLQTSVSMKIRPHMLEEFKQVAAQMLAVTQEKDTGTLQYDWFLNREQTVCVIRETYESSEALLEHFAHLDQALGKRPLSQMAYDHSPEIFGRPSAELVERLQGLSVQWYSFLQGLRE